RGPPLLPKRTELAEELGLIEGGQELPVSGDRDRADLDPPAEEEHDGVGVVALEEQICPAAIQAKRALFCELFDGTPGHVSKEWRGGQTILQIRSARPIEDRTHGGMSLLPLLGRSPENIRRSDKTGPGTYLPGPARTFDRRDLLAEAPLHGPLGHARRGRALRRAPCSLRRWLLRSNLLLRHHIHLPRSYRTKLPL